MEQKLNDIRGNKSLYNIVPTMDNVLIELEYTKSSIEVAESLKKVKHLKVVGLGSNVTEYAIGDIIYFKTVPQGAGRVNVIKPNENCRYIMVSKFDIDGIFTEMTPATEEKTKLDLINPSVDDIKNIVGNK